MAVAKAAVSQCLPELFNSLIAIAHFLYCFLLNTGMLGIVQDTNISMFRAAHSLEVKGKDKS